MVSKYRFVKFLMSLSFVILLSGYAFAAEKETTGEYVDDVVITTKVKAAIMEESNLKTLQIHVTTNQGKVQLSGSVDSQESIKKAGDVAQGVKGVTSVENDLIVK